MLSIWVITHNSASQIISSRYIGQNLEQRVLYLFSSTVLTLRNGDRQHFRSKYNFERILVLFVKSVYYQNV